MKQDALKYLHKTAVIGGDPRQWLIKQRVHNRPGDIAMTGALST
ncbi:hypothetical protein [Candidatus Regiella endosymbiont of Tuberolachnus salignus]